MAALDFRHGRTRTVGFYGNSGVLQQKKRKFPIFPIDNLKKRAIVAKIKTMTGYETTFFIVWGISSILLFFALVRCVDEVEFEFICFCAYIVVVFFCAVLMDATSPKDSTTEISITPIEVLSKTEIPEGTVVSYRSEDKIEQIVFEKHADVTALSNGGAVYLVHYQTHNAFGLDSKKRKIEIRQPAAEDDFIKLGESAQQEKTYRINPETQTATKNAN